MTSSIEWSPCGWIRQTMLGAEESQVGGLLSMGSSTSKSDRMGLPIASQRTTASQMYNHKVHCLTAVHIYIYWIQVHSAFKCMFAVKCWFMHSDSTAHCWVQFAVRCMHAHVQVSVCAISAIYNNIVSFLWDPAFWDVPHTYKYTWRTLTIATHQLVKSSTAWVVRLYITACNPPAVVIMFAYLQSWYSFIHYTDVLLSSYALYLHRKETSICLLVVVILYQIEHFHPSPILLKTNKLLVRICYWYCFTERH